MPARLVLLVALAVAVLLVGACGGDDDAADPTTTTTSSTTTTTGPTTTLPGLAGDLLDPATVGPDMGRSDTPGAGELDPRICPEVTVEQTWTEQAAQALLRGTGLMVVNQAVLRFPDPAAAEAFVAAFADGVARCDATIEVAPRDGVGDGAVGLRQPPDPTGALAVGVLVHAGAKATYLLAVGSDEADLAAVLDDDLLAEAVARLRD